MPNYQQARIYRIHSPLSSKQYIGSTTQPLAKRLSAHKAAYRRYVRAGEERGWISSFEVLGAGLDAVRIEEVEECPCACRRELEVRERHHIQCAGEGCVNKNVPGRSKGEWVSANREHVRAYHSDYYWNKKRAHIRKQQAAYYAANREKVLAAQRAYRERKRANIQGCSGVSDIQQHRSTSTSST